jgi:hypothetical protein
MNDKFVYDEKTSVLYAPNGQALKQVHCPKAMHWNQLTVEDGEERWRGCTQCKERVVNLDVMDVGKAVSLLSQRGSKVCVHGSSESGRVIFLRDRDAIRPAADLKLDEQGRTVIQTARSEAAINRAVNLGYWPDVRLVTFDTKKLRTKVSVGQHVETGRIRLSGDYRLTFRKADDARDLERKAELAEIDAVGEAEDEYTATLREECENDRWVEVVPFTSYYPYFEASPIAAYLIPKHLADGANLLIEDPIEDIVGTTWNQGDAYRTSDIPGKLEGRRVVLGKLEPSTVRRFVG